MPRLDGKVCSSPVPGPASAARLRSCALAMVRMEPDLHTEGAVETGDYAVIDPEKRTARVGGGSLWGTVENEAIKHGLASVAGTVNHVCR